MTLHVKLPRPLQSGDSPLMKTALGEMWTMAELMESAEKDRREFIAAMRHWKWDVKVLVLRHRATKYEIDLERMPDAAAMLDWIFQVATKKWMTPAAVHELLHALKILVHPQGTLCSGALLRNGLPRGFAKLNGI